MEMPPHPHFGSMKKIEVKGGKLTVKFMLYKAIGTLCYNPPPPSIGVSLF